VQAKVALLSRPLGARGGALAALGIGALLVALMGSVTRGEWPTELVTIAAAVVATLALGGLGLVWPRLPQARREEVDLAVDASWITVGTARFARAKIRRALVMPAGSGAVVELHGRGSLRPLVTIAFAEAEAAARFVSEIGHDAARRVAPFVALSPFAGRRGYRPLLASALVASHAAGIALAVALSSYVPIGVAMVAILAACLTSLPSRIEIGVDGLAWIWLGRRRFIPWTKVRSARRVELPGHRTIDALEVDVEGEGPIRFAMARDAVGTDTPERILERIQQARRARAENDTGSAVAALGVVEGADPTAHIARVKKLVARPDEYRASPLRSDQVEGVLADPEAPPATRVLAAVAAVAASAAEGKARVRIAAEATADRDLRAALEAAAAEDEPLLAQRLAALRGR